MYRGCLIVVLDIRSHCAMHMPSDTCSADTPLKADASEVVFEIAVHTVSRATSTSGSRLMFDVGYLITSRVHDTGPASGSTGFGPMMELPESVGPMIELPSGSTGTI